MRPNPAQERAINGTGNLIVSAAAGAGKTTVLTSRVIRLLREGTCLDEMLILTFTHAAAAEMKSRIEKKLAEAEREETDPKQKEHLRRQLLICPNACISTIDSFCASVVRRHYYRLGLAPAMGAVSETEGEILKDEAFRAAAEEMAAEDPERLRVLLRALNDIKTVGKTVLDLHRYLEAIPDRDEWLTKMEEDCRAGRLTAVAEEKLFESSRRELGAAVTAFKAVRDRLFEHREVYEPYIQYASNQLSHIEAAFFMDTPAKYGEVLAGVPVSDRLPTVQPKKDVDGLCTPFKAAREALKTAVTEQRELFAAAGEEETGNAAVTSIVEALLILLRRTEEKFTAAKLDKGKLDFADTEYYAVKLLDIPEVAEEYRRKFRTVIVDEYQDSNYLQEAIFDRIRRPDGLFLVGDVKQSIYGFRNAVPDLFNEKTKRYGGGDGGELILLNCNFRSSNEILQAVNGVFSRLMTPDTGVLQYDESQALYAGKEQPAGKAQFVLIDCKKKEEEEEDGEEDIGRPEAEAAFCVQKIREIMDGGLFDDGDGNTRPYTYRDFVILLRNRNTAAEMAKTITAAGIPCFAESKGGYFESIEVQLFMNVLRIIDNRRQDIPLISVMRSMIGDFSDAELIAIRQLAPKKEKRFLECLLLAAEKEPGGKADLFLKRIELWRKKSLYLPARELCSLLLDETGLLREMSMLPGGNQRELNLNEALALANEYDRSGAFGLHGFLRFVDKAREKDKAGAAATDSGNVVRIMTVHKSKGLEFPVVFYCNLCANFNTKDASQSMLFDSGVGIGLKYTDVGNLIREPRLYKLLQKRVRDKNREEEMRVLYVGMTRAKRQLYMVGSVKDLEKTLNELPETPTPDMLKKAKNPLRWLLLTKNPDLPLLLADPCVPDVHEAEKELPPPDPENLRRLVKKLSRAYPFPAPAGVPNKTSATALSGGERVYSFSEDPFSSEEKTPGENALTHGTKIHALLERMPLAKEKEEARRALLEPLPERDRASVEWFLRSKLFARMQISPLCRRELPFTAAVESGTLPGLEAGEKVLLQGVIDCCFTEGDGYVILDYKTDSLIGKTAEEQAETHREQVELYARVLQMLTGRPVLEKYIVFITGRAVVRLD